MTEEKFLSGYCRQIDGVRTVSAELECSTVTFVDCCFDSCIYRQSCPIAKQIDELNT